MEKYCTECGKLLKDYLLIYDYKSKYVLQKRCSSCDALHKSELVEYVSQELTQNTIKDLLTNYIDELADELNISLLKERLTVNYNSYNIIDNAAAESNHYRFRDLEYSIDLPIGLADRVAHKLNEYMCKLSNLPRVNSHTIFRWPFDHSIELAIYSVEHIKPYTKITFVGKGINVMKTVYFKKVKSEN